MTFARLRRSIPNLLTCVRIGISPVIILGAHIAELRPIILILIPFGVLTDKLDGTLARWLKVESEYGKKIESIADPIFCLACTYYVMRRTDFPVDILLIGLGLFIISTLGRGIAYFYTKKFFYVKSPITQYATAMICLTILVYIFLIPGRLIIAYIGLLYGIVAMFNYIWMVRSTIAGANVSPKT